MSHTSKLTAKNQTTIPKAIVELLRIKPSALLVYDVEPDGRVVLSSKSATFEELAESFPKKARSKKVTDEDITAAVRRGAARRLKKAAR